MLISELVSASGDQNIVNIYSKYTSTPPEEMNPHDLHTQELNSLTMTDAILERQAEEFRIQVDGYGIPPAEAAETIGQTLGRETQAVNYFVRRNADIRDTVAVDHEVLQNYLNR